MLHFQFLAFICIRSFDIILFNLFLQPCCCYEGSFIVDIMQNGTACYDKIEPRNKSVLKPSPFLDFSVNKPINSLYCFNQLEIGFLLHRTHSAQIDITITWRDASKLSLQLSLPFS